HVLVVGRVRGDVTHRRERRDLVARGRRRDQEDRDAVVLLRVRVGAGGEPDVVGVLRLAGEQLAAVDDPLVAVAHRAGTQRRQVGAGAGLGVADGEVHVAVQRLRQEELLLLLRAVLHDHRAHRHDGERRQQHARPPRLVEEDELLDRRPSLAAVLLGPADTEPTVGAHLLERAHVLRAAALAGGELGLVRGRDDFAEVGADLLLQRAMLGRQVDEHGRKGYAGPRAAVKHSSATGASAVLAQSHHISSTARRNTYVAALRLHPRTTECAEDLLRCADALDGRALHVALEVGRAVLAGEMAGADGRTLDTGEPGVLADEIAGVGAAPERLDRRRGERGAAGPLAADPGEDALELPEKAARRG